MNKLSLVTLVALGTIMIACAAEDKSSAGASTGDAQSAAAAPLPNGPLHCTGKDADATPSISVDAGGAVLELPNSHHMLVIPAGTFASATNVTVELVAGELQFNIKTSGPAVSGKSMQLVALLTGCGPGSSTNKYDGKVNAHDSQGNPFKGKSPSGLAEDMSMAVVVDIPDTMLKTGTTPGIRESGYIIIGD